MIEEIGPIIHFTSYFRVFLQKDNYEDYILKVMNRSIIFDGDYIKNDDGTKDNQSDYYDKKNNRYIDVKIILAKEMMRHFANKNYEGFAEEIKKQTSIVTDGYLNNLEENELFKIVEDTLINKVNINEDCIMFSPLPFDSDTRPFKIFGLGQDNIQICYLKLKEKYKNELANKNVYYISFTNNGYICVRKISDECWHRREYLDLKFDDDLVPFSILDS